MTLLSAGAQLLYCAFLPANANCAILLS
jgi:hypothetical protein